MKITWFPQRNAQRNIPIGFEPPESCLRNVLLLRAVLGWGHSRRCQSCSFIKEQFINFTSRQVDYADGTELNPVSFHFSLLLLLDLR